MSEDDFQDLSDSDYTGMPSGMSDAGESIASDIISQKQQAVNAGLDQDPEEAVEALRLEKLTGVPAPAIMADQDGFKDTLRRSSAQQIVLGNPILSDYVSSNAMASVVSADDWGNLDTFTRGLNASKSLFDSLKFSGGEEISRLWDAAKGGYGEAYPAAEYNQAVEQYGKIGAATADVAARLLGVVPQTFNALMAVGSQAITDTPGFMKLDELMTGRQRDPEAAKAELAENIGMLLMNHGSEIGPREEMPAAAKPYAEALDAARPWTENGQEAPSGLHPIIDQLKGEINAQGVDHLGHVLDDAVKSFTRERDPDLFRKLAEQANVDTKISIHGDAALALYGDKSPEPDDGILGWVPNIEAQLAQARDGGSDVEIPLKDWLARVDPEIAKGLKDDIRIWPGGITKNEAKEPIEPRAVLPSTLAQVRGAAGLEPKFAIGDRPLEVAPEEDQRRAGIPPEEESYYEPRSEGNQLFWDLHNRSLEREEEFFPRNMSPEAKANSNAAIREITGRGAVSSTDILDSPQARATLDGRFGEPIQAFTDFVNRFWEHEGFETQFTPEISREWLAWREAHPNDPIGNPAFRSEERMNEVYPGRAERLAAQRSYRSPAGWSTVEPEPTQSIPKDYGPRDKESLKGLTLAPKQIDAWEQGSGYHRFEILDQNGVSVGDITLVDSRSADGKGLWVQWVGGSIAQRINGFGPALVLAIKRQIKEQFPDKEYIAGYRISGARNGNAVSQYLSAERKVAKVKLSTEGPTTLDEHQTFLDMLSTPGWDVADTSTEAIPRIQAQAIIDEGRRLVGKDADIQPVVGIASRSGQTVRGKYQAYYNSPPTMLVDLLGPDALGITRHESIHWLRGNGFFTDAEWSTLEQAARNEGWLDRYGINDRYARLGESDKLEEAIAEGFREWARQAENVRPKTGIGGIFQKLWEFLDRVRMRMGRMLGRKLSWDEVFKETLSGRVAERGPGAPEHPEQFDMRAKHSIEDDTTRRIQQTVLDIGGGLNQRVWIKDIKDRLPDLTSEQINAVLRRLHETPDNGFNVSGSDNPIELTRGEGPARKAAGFDYKSTQMYTAWQTKALEAEKASDTSLPAAEGSGASALPPSPPRPVDALPPEPRPEGPMRLSPPAVGVPKRTFGQYERALEAQHAADIAADQKRFEAQERRRQTQEWKDNEQAVRKEVSASIMARPDIAVDQLLGAGRIKGEKLARSYTLAADDLTPEQKAAIPSRYVSKDGLPAETIAGSFGFRSMQDMVDGIAALQREKLTPEGKPIKMDDYIRGLIKQETARRMEAQHGRLEDNIMSAAVDHALSRPSLDLVYEDYKKAAEEAGKPAVDKAIVQQVARQFVDRNAITKANSFRLMQDAAGQSRRAELLHFNRDPISMADPMQKRTILSYAAAEARRLEKEIKEFKRSAKTWRQRAPDTIDPEYTNYIHQIMNQIGMKVNRTPEDLQRQLEYRARGASDLKSFVEREMSNGAVLAPWDQLYDQTWHKDFNDLTGEEFRKARDFLKSLVKQGRDVKKVMVEGEMRYMDEVREKLVSAFDKWEPTVPLEPGVVRRTFSRLIQPEFFIDRLDDWNPGGAWNQIFYRPFKEAEGMKRRRLQEVAADIRDIQSRPRWTEAVDNPGLIRYPKEYGGGVMPLTRENLIAAMLNIGSEGNLKAFMRGYGIEDAAALENWIHDNARPEDWAFVKKVWSVFQKTRQWSDDMYLEQAGVPMQWTEGRTITTRGGQQIEGSYYPLHYDRTFHESSAHGPISDQAVFGHSYETGILPSNGYTIERTNPGDRVALTLDQLPNKIMQQIHDASMRPALTNAVKILRDKQIEATIKQRYGAEYHTMLMDMVKRSANAAAFAGDRNKAQQTFRRISDTLRRNMAITMIGGNIGTVLKHGPTAMITSVIELGDPARFFSAYRQLYQIDDATGESWNRRMYKLSDALQERHQSMLDSVYGATDEVRGRVSGYTKLATQIGNASLYPVMWSDLLSTKPLWLSKYFLERERGSTIGSAVYQADKAVRKAHGSMSMSSKAMIMTDISPWFTMFHNFYNDILNRTIEAYWKAGVMTKAFKGGDMPKGLKFAPQVATGMFVGIAVPWIIHSLVDPPESHPNDSWLVKMARFLIHPASMYFPGARDFGNYIIGSDSPDVGMLTALYKETGQFAKDWMKNEPLSVPHAQVMMRHFGGLIGALTGLPGRLIGNVGSSLYGMAQGTESPQGPGDVVSLYRHGTLRGPK